MYHHLSRALAQTYANDLDRAARQRPQPRRRRRATRPRDSLNDIAHAASPPTVRTLWARAGHMTRPRSLDDIAHTTASHARAAHEHRPCAIPTPALPKPTKGAFMPSFRPLSSVSGRWHKIDPEMRSAITNAALDVTPEPG